MSDVFGSPNQASFSTLDNPYDTRKKPFFVSYNSMFGTCLMPALIEHPSWLWWKR